MLPVSIMFPESAGASSLGECVVAEKCRAARNAAFVAEDYKVAHPLYTRGIDHMTKGGDRHAVGLLVRIRANRAQCSLQLFENGTDTFVSR